MEVLVGNREDCKLFAQEGFLYVRNKRRPDKQYVKCHSNGCFCYGLISEREGGVSEIRILHEDHNHPPDQNEVDVLKLKRELREACVNDKRPPRQIFDDICRRYPTVRHLLSYPSARYIMEKARKKNKPPIPHSISEMSRMLEGEWAHLGLTLGENPEPFYVACIESTDSSCAIFASPSLIEMMNQSQDIHIDATFKVVPTELNGYQFCTIHAVYMDMVFPAVFILMDRKTTEAYVDVFTYIRDVLIPEFSPKTVMADYETAIKNAVNNVWPGATVNGCWFHYAQGVWKMHKSMRMSQMTEGNPVALKGLKMIMCLPLLPENKIPEGLTQIRQYLSESGLEEAFNDLMEYIHEYWISTVGPEIISVYGLLHRTNNAVESFYSEIGGLIGKHPGVWDFLDRLRLVEDTKSTDYLRLKNGINPTRRRRRAFRRQDSTIHDAGERLRISNFTRVREFLERVSYRVTTLERNLRYPRRRATIQEPLIEPQHNDEEQVPVLHEPVLPDEAELVVVPSDSDGEELVPLAGPRNVAPIAVQNNGPFERPVEGEIFNTYEMYRIVPILVNDNNFMSEADVRQQQRELLLSLTLGNEPSYEAAEEGEVVCIVCFTNAPTRTCTPCGHAIVCRNCLPDFIRTERFHSVIEANGNTYETGIRLPLTCPTCRSIIGQLIQTY